MCMCSVSDLNINCSVCECSIPGSLSLNCNVSGQCECKSNTEERDCSQCIHGTYNLQQSNPSGCQPCFCSGKSNNCSSASGYAATTIITRFNESGSHGWTIDNETDLSHNSFGIALEPNTASYLRAPPIFVNNKLSSYSRYLTVAINSSNTTTTTVHPADVVLSSMGLSLGINFSIPMFDDGVNIIRIHLHEVAGWTDTTSNLPVDAYDLQLVLSSLEDLYVTASYSEPVTISFIALESTEIASMHEDEVQWVEHCACPSNYSGLSCELCADGYTRSSSGSCELCQCNGFSDSCESETGICTDCDNYTTGDSCEFCRVGSYGNPLRQIPCQPCPCPLTTEPGQFSTNCSIDEEIICFDCPPGHTGLQCESCVNGYYGDPTGVFTGIPTVCSDCNCSGNADISSPEICNNVSGLCLRCLNNTSGDQCEVCADGYYGDAITAKNCSGKLLMLWKLSFLFTSDLVYRV